MSVLAVVAAEGALGVAQRGRLAARTAELVRPPPRADLHGPTGDRPQLVAQTAVGHDQRHEGGAVRLLFEVDRPHAGAVEHAEEVTTGVGAVEVGEREERDGDLAVRADDDDVIVGETVGGAVEGGTEVGHATYCPAR